MTMDACSLLVLLSFAGAVQLAGGISSSGDLNLTRNCLLAGVSVTSVFTFLSAHFQLSGLIGAKGLIPLSATLSTLNIFLKSVKIRRQGWLSQDRLMTGMLQLVFEKFNSSGDPAKQLSIMTLVDVFVSVVSFFYPHPVLFAYLYISYYSIKRVGGRFFNFQWDALLLETLFLSVLLSMAYDNQTIAMCMWAFKALLFRLMFGSGVVKFCGRDESWNKSYTAMAYHFLTQPLPTKWGMYARNYLPQTFFRYLTVGSLVIELVVPVLSLLNLTWLNRLCCATYLLLQASIAATGYYGFFNYLTMVLCISLLDDTLLTSIMRMCTGETATSRILEVISVHSYYSAGHQKVRVVSAFALVFRALCTCVLYPALVLLFVSHVVSLYLLAERVGGVSNALSTEYTRKTGTNSGIHSTVHDFCRLVPLPLHNTLMHVLYLGNHYGLFANMTKLRNEISIEVSTDKVVWRSVEFVAKPGDINIPPKSIPFYHLPRLDWAMWFVALRPTKKDLPQWFWVLLVSIMTGDSDDVLGLLSIRGNEGVVGNRVGKFEYVRATQVNYRYSGRVGGTVGATSTTGATDGADTTTTTGTSTDTTAKTTQPVPPTPPTPPTPSAPITPPTARTAGTYWSTLPVATILPPTSLAELYAVLDSHDEAIAQREASREPPSAEDAKDIIMRTLFSKLRGRKGKED